MAYEQATKVFRDSNGIPVLHGKIVRHWRTAPGRDCEEQLEFRGDRVVDDDGNVTIEWIGTPFQREVYCPVHGAVTSVPTVYGVKRAEAGRVDEKQAEKDATPF